MSCNKCHEIFQIEELPSKIYFISEVDELIRKITLLFKKLGHDLYSVHGLKCIKTENPKSFLKIILKTSTVFSTI
ncbi:MAG: hypothetical protein OIF32_02570 [Campylobacterales bacterium]|nr:hypothetical protein [Campylobacterales bacterium]